jgi:hypothetical protein
VGVVGVHGSANETGADARWRRTPTPYTRV